MSQSAQVSEAQIAEAIAALTGESIESRKYHAPRCGVYAIRLTTSGLLRPFSDGERGLIYVGMSKDLGVREFDMHFNSNQTGFSTVRRSLGTILKRELNLRAQPRGPGASKSNFTNYRFDPMGEE